LREIRIRSGGDIEFLPENMRNENTVVTCDENIGSRDTAIRAARIRVDKIEVPGNETPDDTSKFLERVAQAIPPDCAVTLDLTQGLRHHAFLFFALTLYLGQMRNVEIQGAWYCRWEISSSSELPKPFIDLKSVIDLANWFHALAVVRSSGSFSEVLPLIESGAKDQLARLSAFFMTGLPLETGDAASRVGAYSANKIGTSIPLSEEIHEYLFQLVKPLQGQMISNGSKKQIVPTPTELDRQALMIERYFETGQLNLAFGLMREWIVNTLMQHRNNGDVWFKHSSRQEVERRLGALSQILKGRNATKCDFTEMSRQLSADAKRMGAIWRDTCDIRNSLQHHGMRAEAIDLEGKLIRRMRQEWQDRATWPLDFDFGGGQGKLLVCPVGMTPGVLYTAILHDQPNRIMAICSEESKQGALRAIAESQFQGEYQTLSMTDPHTGVSEFKAILGTAAMWIFEADTVDVYVGGGTALMGVLAEQVAALAKSELQRDVRRFVGIDKRPYQEQASIPWVKGDVYQLS